MKEIAIQNGHAQPILHIPQNCDIFHDSNGPNLHNNITIIFNSFRYQPEVFQGDGQYYRADRYLKWPFLVIFGGIYWRLSFNATSLLRVLSFSEDVLKATPSILSQ